MCAFYVEEKGRNGEYFRLHPTSLTDREVIHTDPSSGGPVSISADNCLLWEDDGRQFDSPLSPGDAVEMLRESDGCWWPASVFSVKGDFVTCVLQYGSEQEVADRACVRPAGHFSPLASVHLHQCRIELPQLPPQFAAAHRSTEAEVRAELTNCLSSPYLVLLPGNGVVDDATVTVVVLATPSQSDAKRLALISLLVGRRLCWKAAVRFDMSGIASRLANVEADVAAASAAAAARRPRLLEEFSVPRHLAGLALGARGVNALEARKLPGVVSVYYDNTAGVFRVFGISPESAASARRMLELAEATLRPPSRLVGRLLGKGGHVAQTVVDKAGLHNLIVGEEGNQGADADGGGDAEMAAKDEIGGVVNGDHQEAGPTTTIRLIGTREAVDNGRFILEFQLDMQRNLDQLHREMWDAKKLLFSGGRRNEQSVESAAPVVTQVEQESPTTVPKETSATSAKVSPPVSKETSATSAKETSSAAASARVGRVRRGRGRGGFGGRGGGDFGRGGGGGDFGGGGGFGGRGRRDVETSATSAKVSPPVTKEPSTTSAKEMSVTSVNVAKETSATSAKVSPPATKEPSATSAKETSTTSAKETSTTSAKETKEPSTTSAKVPPPAAKETSATSANVSKEPSTTSAKVPPPVSKVTSSTSAKETQATSAKVSPPIAANEASAAAASSRVGRGRRGGGSHFQRHHHDNKQNGDNGGGYNNNNYYYYSNYHGQGYNYSQQYEHYRQQRQPQRQLGNGWHHDSYQRQHQYNNGYNNGYKQNYQDT